MAIFTDSNEFQGATTISGASTLSGATAVSGALTTTGTVDMTGSTVSLPASAVDYSPQVYELTVLFSDLGAGASDAHALAGFPTNVYVLGAGVLINTAFAGEADLSVIVGDTGDDNGLMTVTVVDALVATTFTAADGAETGFHFESDFAGDGADITFTATELNDVTAGSLTLRVLYIDPTP